jgi:hypothetical protein
MSKNRSLKKFTEENLVEIANQILCLRRMGDDVRQHIAALNPKEFAYWFPGGVTTELIKIDPIKLGVIASKGLANGSHSLWRSTSFWECWNGVMFPQHGDGEMALVHLSKFVVLAAIYDILVVESVLQGKILQGGYRIPIKLQEYVLRVRLKHSVRLVLS